MAVVVDEQTKAGSGRVHIALFKRSIDNHAQRCREEAEALCVAMSSNDAKAMCASSPYRAAHFLQRRANLLEANDERIVVDDCVVIVIVGHSSSGIVVASGFGNSDAIACRLVAERNGVESTLWIIKAKKKDSF